MVGWVGRIYKGAWGFLRLMEVCRDGCCADLKQDVRKATKCYFMSLQNKEVKWGNFSNSNVYVGIANFSPEQVRQIKSFLPLKHKTYTQKIKNRTNIRSKQYAVYYSTCLIVFLCLLVGKRCTAYTGQEDSWSTCTALYERTVLSAPWLQPIQYSTKTITYFIHRDLQH